MEKASIQTAELGNILFGHSREEYHMDRPTYQKIFENFLYKIGLDVYGFAQNGTIPRQRADEPTVENPVFLIRPYCWDETLPDYDKPNFVYKPLGIEISWYKYALRDAYCSHDITPEQLESILKTCENNLQVYPIVFIH